MNIQTIKTHAIEPKESLFDVLNQYITELSENTIIAITSKIISLCQGQVVLKQEVKSKYELIKQQADAFLEEEHPPYNVHLTIAQNILIPSAGIDESNGNGLYILYPTEIEKTVEIIWLYLRKIHLVENLGILITDSHTTPLRRGVTGIALAWYGFEPLYSYIGKPDIFGRPLQVTQINIVDALAASAVLMMGEGAEQTPIAIINNAPKIHFLSNSPSAEKEQKNHSVSIPLEEDIYAPLLRNAKWIWNPKKSNL